MATLQMEKMECRGNKYIHYMGGREVGQFLNEEEVILGSRDLETDFRKDNGTPDATLGSGVRCVASGAGCHHPDIC